MSLMGFREPNYALRVGIRPGHDGTQVVATETCDNSTVIVYTVTSGKVLYLCEGMLSIPSLVTGKAVLALRDTGDNFWRSLCRIRAAAATTVQANHVNFWPPLEVPSGYDIYITSTQPGLTILGEIHGWEE